MANNLFNLFNRNQSGGTPNIQQQMSMLKSNPVGFLMQRKLNIPTDIQNDPKAIVQHLLNTGQMSQSQFDQIQNYIKNTQGQNNF